MPAPTPRDRIPEIDDPKTRLIEAGTRLLLDEGFTVLESGLSPDRVAKIAARSRRTFYDHFPAKSEFVRETLERSLDLSDHEVINVALTALFTELIDESEGDVLATVESISEMNFNAQLASETTIMQMIAWALGRQDGLLRPQLLHHFRTVDEFFAQGFEALLQAWNRKLRPPWTYQSAAAALRALADGLYVRVDLDPDFDQKLFGLTVLSLFAGATQTSEEPDQSVADHLRLVSEEAALRWREQVEPSQVVNARERVMDALLVELERRGYAHTTLDSIAVTAGVSHRTVVSAFGAVDEMVIAAIEANLPRFDQEVQFDLGTPELKCRQVVERHLRRLALFGAEHAPLLRAVTAVGTNPERLPALEKIRGQLREPLVMALRQAQTAGEFRPAEGVEELAALMTEALLSWIVADSDRKPADLADTLTALVFEGAGG